MFWLYNHHYAEFPNEYNVEKRPSSIGSTPIENLKDCNSAIVPWYWVEKSLVDNRLIDADKNGKVRWQWKHSFYIAFRDVTNATNERTCVATVMPSMCFVAMMSSLVYDYVSRQKVGGSHLNLFIVEQQPTLTPDQIPKWAKALIVERVAELCYFNHDMDGWMDELWHDEEMTDDLRTAMLDRLKECNHLYFDDDKYPMPEFNNMQPYIYNEQRRAIAQAELDAIFAHLYGLNTEDLRYILDPEDVCGEGCINETFRVLKDKEISQYGEYRTKRLVLEAWNRFGFDK